MAYHIKKDGTPGICRAKNGNCPLGGSSEHYESKEAAESAAQDKLEKQYGVTREDKEKDYINKEIEKYRHKKFDESTLKRNYKSKQEGMKDLNKMMKMADQLLENIKKETPDDSRVEKLDFMVNELKKQVKGIR